MSYLTYGLGTRRAPTARVKLAFAGGLASVLVMLVLIGAVVVASQQPGQGNPGRADGSGAGSTIAGLGANQGGEAGQAGDPTPGTGRGPASAVQPAPVDPPTPPAPPASPAPPAPQPAGPVIESFKVTQQPMCPGGTDLHPVEGQPVTLAWKVTGADGDEVSLSIDGPGVYDTYPAQGSDVIHFPCEGEEGDLQKHTYLLTAVGDGGTVTESLVVTAKVQPVSTVSSGPVDG